MFLTMIHKVKRKIRRWYLLQYTVDSIFPIRIRCSQQKENTSTRVKGSLSLT